MQVRGSIVSALPRFIQDKFGDEGFQSWIRAITPQARDVYLYEIKADDWYEMKPIMIEPMAQVARLFYNWDLKASAWELGRFSADLRFKGLLKILVKLPKAQYMIGKAGEFLSSYYRPCAIEVPESRDGFAVLRITHFPEMEKTIEYRIAGWAQRGLEINGCRNVDIQLSKSLTEQAKYSEFRISWK